MVDPVPAPGLSIPDLLEEREHYRQALQLIADAVRGVRRPSEILQMIGDLANDALEER